MISNILSSSPEHLCRSGKTLLRLTKLDNALSLKRNREQVISELANIWRTAQKTLSISLNDALQLSDKKLQLLGPRIHAIYIPELKESITIEAFHKTLRRFFKDTYSLTISPLKKSHRGNKGPTFLVSYSRPDHSFQTTKLHYFVLKWTDWNEVCCNRLYGAFLSNFSGKAPNNSLCTPLTANIDFSCNIYEKADGSQIQLSLDLSNELNETFLAIARAKMHVPDEMPKDKQIMLSERIQGENLFDFARTKYPFLSEEQKKSIFHRLGEIAMLDVVMGNLDRLVQIMGDGEEYQLDNFEANLGNVMVYWTKQEEEPPLLYAIDNGIDLDLIHSTAHKKQYLMFLQTLFQDPEMEKTLACNLKETMQSALRTQADDVSEGNTIEIRKELELFTQDVNSLGEEMLATGFVAMASKLSSILIPKWEEEEAIALKQHLAWTYPELLEAIDERLNIFKQTRKIS